ncbi:hypothetical protein AALA90_18590 [Lachnospiraceae bacterium 38-10]
MRVKKLVGKYMALLLIGGAAYVLLELVWRQRSHWTMFILGGMCFVCLGLINELISWDMSLWQQILIGSCIVTGLEFLTGCIVNLWLGWDVWDYSGLPGNILGQICPQFFVLWLPVAMAAIVLDDWIRYWWWDEEHPRYNIGLSRRKPIYI